MNSTVPSSTPQGAVAPQPRSELALALGGGGARAAYQAGVLHAISHAVPTLEIPVLSGVSAGAIVAAYYANHTGTFQEKAQGMADLWLRLESSRVFRVDASSLFSRVFSAAAQLVVGGSNAPAIHSFVDTTPLRKTLCEAFEARDSTLPGIAQNIEHGKLKAVALTTTCYSTGQTVTFFSGRGVQAWDRPQRKSVQTNLTVDHVMASAALPLAFPSIRIGDLYYGDGGLRLIAPFASAVHLGAEKILAVSNRYQRTGTEAEGAVVHGPPSPAQVLGLLYNATFLDALDHDALMMDRINRLIRKLPPDEREGFREVKLLLIRPSEDLGMLANRFEPQLPRAFRYLTRRLGTRRARTQDFLSTLTFHPDYLRALYDLGVRDAEDRLDEITVFLRD